MPCLLLQCCRLAEVILLLICGHHTCNAFETENEKTIAVEARFAASNVIYVTIETSFTVTEPDKVSVHFVLNEENRILDYRAVSHHSNHQLSSMVLRYSLWLAEEIFSANLTLQTHLSLDSSSSSLSSNNQVRRLPDRRPPRISHMLWHNSTVHQGISLCTPLHCATPPPPIYVMQGDRVSISCAIDPISTTRPIEIQWFRNGALHETTKYTKRDDVIDRIKVQNDDDSVYQCKARTEYGVSISHKVTVYSIDFHDPAITEQMLRKPDGSSVKLLCNISSVTSHTPRGSVVVTWTKDSQLLQTNSRILAFHEEGVLIIREIRGSDAGRYSCIVENIELGNEKTIDIASITVPGEPLETQDVEELYGQSDYPEVLVDSPLTLRCVFSSSDIITWNIPNDVLNYSVSNVNTTLHIRRVPAAANNKLITCQTLSKSATKTFTLSVQAKPVISQSSSVKSVTVGQRVHLKCDVNSPENLETAWYFNEQRVSELGSSLTWEGEDVGKDKNGEVICSINSKWGKSTTATSLFVYDKTVIAETEIEVHEDTIRLHCIAQADNSTPLNITWYAVDLDNGQMTRLNDVKKEGILITNNSLSVPRHLVYSHNLTCEASNGFSTAQKLFEDLIQYAPAANSRGSSLLSKSSWEDISPLLILVAVASTVVAIAIVLGFSSYKCFKVYRVSKSNQSDTRSYRTPSRINSYPDDHSQEMLLRESMSLGRQFSINDMNCNTLRSRKSSWLSNNADLQTLVTNVFVDRPRIDVQEIVGKGQFGRVYKGMLRDESGINCGLIAIKTLKYKSNETEMVDLFLREAVIMKNFRHQNVLSLIGISVDIDGSPMVVLPYMSRGDLRGYILNQDTDVTVLDLLKLAIQVARGMDYLSAQKFVHRDLACRNCMVDENNCVKVADFGLSRDLFSRDYYRDSPGKHPLPVRWMAPECHRNNVFTTQSDVWSFGVLLWELMTRGLTPYYEVENWQVPSHIMSGASLDQPEYCPDSIYEVMVGCWYREPQARAAFSEIVQQIEDIILTARTGTTYDSERFYHNIERPEEKPVPDSESIPTTSV